MSDLPSPSQSIQRVVQLQAAGRLEEAEALCRRVLESQCPESAVVNHLLGFLNHQLGRTELAAQLIGRAVSLNPREPEFLCNLGAVLLAGGKPAESTQACRQALVLRPEFPEALVNLGNALAAAGQYNEAAQAYRQAISLRPGMPETYNNLGNVLRELDKPDEAIAAYRQAMALRPEYADAHANLGIALQQTGRIDEAIDALNAAVNLRPNHPETLNSLGNTLIERDRLDDAIAMFRRALALQPNHARAQNNLGAALLKQKDYDGAIKCYHLALAIEPCFAEAHANLGLTLQAMGKTDEAIASFRRAIDARPQYADALTYLAASLAVKGLLDEAIALNQQALQMQPEHADGHMSLALFLLSQGRFREGWPEYEWRRRTKTTLINHGAPEEKQWRGEDLRGRRILIYCEQGRGDVIHYARYVPLVAQRGGRVILEAYPELRRLLQTLPGVEQMVELKGAVPSFDLHCQLPSLPYIFDTTLETIPASVPYLHADPKLAEAWRQRVGRAGDGLKIGLVWAGNPDHSNNHNRSMHLEDFAPLREIGGVQFFSLQLGDPARQIAAATNPLEITDWTGELEDYADTAALVENLDLIISVDTSVAHLAGAMGKQVWVLVSHPADFRWLLDRRDTPWYPTMRLFRQNLTRTWDTPLKSLVSGLREFAESKR
jgi:tetratricopeptide (TPR) repeat protein